MNDETPLSNTPQPDIQPQAQSLPIPTTIEPTSSTKTQTNRVPVTAISLVLAIVIVFVILLSRFVYGASGDRFNTTSTALGQATTVATGTTAPGNSTWSQSGTTIPGETPLVTQIASGYPDPRYDTPFQQQERSNLAPNAKKFIIISLDGQYLQAFENDKLVRWTYVTTGRPSLATPGGFYHVFQKLSPVYFIPLSTDPKSPLFEYPSYVNYGLAFAEGGYFIHDAWWRTVYGPNLTTWHYDPGRNEYQEGSHGCVNTPLETMTWLFVWADLGTPVYVY
jgi:lipoprotein-anchoring transpeptidase ErfK/SrfK